MQKLRPQSHLIITAIASIPVGYRELAARAIHDYIKLVNIQRGFTDTTSGDFDVPAHELHHGEETSELAIRKHKRTRKSFADKVHVEMKFCGARGAIPEEIATIMNAEVIDVRRAFHVLKKLKKIHFTHAWRKNDKDNYCEVWSTMPVERKDYGFEEYQHAPA